MFDENKANKPVEIVSDGVQAANPFLPHWERIPDGEPRIFVDPWSGKERLYVYGSHESSSFACGPEHVVWSAPLDDLTKWRYEGLAIKTTDLEGIEYIDKSGKKCSLTIQPNHVLYAPDVIYNPTTKKYTLFGFLAEADPASFMFVATSDTPGGPFIDPRFIGWGFDPAVLVDDVPDAKGNSRMYLYWSVEENRTGWAAELDPETVTIIPETIHFPRENGIVDGNYTMFSNVDAPFHFFEGPSIRKIENTYVLSYARSKPSKISPIGCLAEIAYAYSDNPFGDPSVGNAWTYGGVIIDNRGEYVKDPYEEGTYTYTWFGLNNHGGLIQIGENWYQIYHRGSNKNFKRQGMATQVNVYFDESGALHIDQAEYTSEGFNIGGLDPYQRLYAASACYALPMTETSWLKTVGPVITSNDDNNFDPNAERENWYGVSHLTNKSWLGFKYYNFGEGVDENTALKLQLILKTYAPAVINIYASDAKNSYEDSEKEKIQIGRIVLEDKNENVHMVDGEIENKAILKGRKGIYLEFLSESEESIAEINTLCFIK